MHARLGTLRPDGVAPAVFGLVDRGIMRRPHLAQGVRGELVLKLEGHPAVRVLFEGDAVLVEDGDGERPDAVIAGRMSDVVRLLAAPGLRSALGALATGRVSVTGKRMFARRFLALLALNDR